MVVAFPVFGGNARLASCNLSWARHMDGLIANHECLLVHPSEMDSSSIRELAGSLFSKVSTVTYNVLDTDGWPLGKNLAFQSAARHVHANYRVPWLWWEPDAVPLKPGWLDAIESAHVSAGRSFSGTMLPVGFMDAVAVYPWDFPEHSMNAMLCRAAPFDQVLGSLTGCVNESELFQAVWSRNGAPPTFPDMPALKALNPEAVLFHRCRDGSLVERLAGWAVKHDKKRNGAGELLLDRIKKLFARPEFSVKARTKTCIVILGRYGDVINALPVARKIQQKEGSCAVMVHRDFADVLDGVNYVEKEIFNGGSFTDVNAAVEHAKSKYPNVLVGQVNGRDFGITAECDSFCADSWRQMGYLQEWSSAPLIFDARDINREVKLRKKWASGRKQAILVNLSGKSSPYPFADILMEQIVSKWSGNFDIVDLSKVQADRIYDLLGLFDHAHCLITTDTSTLHLAHASRVPMIALVTDTPTLWHGARPRGNCILSLRYKESKYRMEEIHRAITMLGFGKDKIIHIYSQYQRKDEDTRRREGLAKQSWECQSWVDLPIYDEVLGRLFDDGKRKLPHILDLIEKGMSGTGGDDIILLTNSDTCFTADATRRIFSKLQYADACYSFRRDFGRVDRILNPQEVGLGQYYPGVDMFAFRVRWWKKNGVDFPDLLIGTEFWDWCLRALIDKAEFGKPCVFNDLIFHEKHPSVWDHPENRKTLPSQMHNTALAMPYLKRLGVNVAAGPI